MPSLAYHTQDILDLLWSLVLIILSRPGGLFWVWDIWDTCMEVSCFNFLPPAAAAPPSISDICQTQKSLWEICQTLSWSLPPWPHLLCIPAWESVGMHRTQWWRTKSRSNKIYHWHVIHRWKALDDTIRNHLLEKSGTEGFARKWPKTHFVGIKRFLR